MDLTDGEMTFVHKPSLGAAGLSESQLLAGLPELQSEAITEAPSNPLDNMDDDALMNTVEELGQNYRNLTQENLVFLHFLQKNDPTLLAGMQHFLSSAHNLQERASICRRVSTVSRKSITPSLELGSTTASLFAIYTGPTINLTQKSDLVMKEMEDIQATVEEFSKRMYIIRCRLAAELEEMSIREDEIHSSISQFENLKQSFEPNTMPVEKFFRYLDEWYRKARLLVDKIRLRTSSLKIHLQKISTTYAQKRLIGENLQEVDFEQLRIENVHLVEKIDNQNLLLLEMKRMNGRANLQLTQHKNHLQKKIEDMETIKTLIKEKKQDIVKVKDEADKTYPELSEAKSEYYKVKDMINTHYAPDVLEYVQTKIDAEVLKKDLKAWARRKQMKIVTLKSAIKQMKRITGCKKTLPSWFEGPKREEIPFPF